MKSKYLFFMENCSICYKWFIHAHHYVFGLIIFNSNNFPFLLQRHLFSDNVFTGMRVGQHVTHMESQQYQTKTIQSIPDGENQVPPCIFSCPWSCFTRIYSQTKTYSDTRYFFTCVCRTL